jgi:methionyl-tRNA formyltransferase
MSESAPKLAFFGGEPLGVTALKALIEANLKPELVVCNPDRPSGRGQKLSPPAVKVLAEEQSIEVFQPSSYKQQSKLNRLIDPDWDLFIVVAYNFILPKWVLELPSHGVINAHPSLLPKLRGASPIRTAIKDDQVEAVGATIMLMDEHMDHGPLLAQQALPLVEDHWPVPGPDLDMALAEQCGSLLAKVIPQWLAGEITPTPQAHDHATYCHRFSKTDAKLALNPLELPNGEAARAALHHIYAFAGIGDSYFEHEGQRIKIKQAKLNPDGSLRLLRVTPAGKSEMDFEQYLQIIS